MGPKGQAVVDGVETLRAERAELLDIVRAVADSQVLQERSDGTAVLLPNGVLDELRRLADL